MARTSPPANLLRTGAASDGTASSMVRWETWLQAALKTSLDLPPLSPASAAIAAMAADGEANTTVLAQRMEQDPTVAANVLRVANSAALAPRMPIVTLTQAIARLGLREIQAIAMSVAVRSRLYAGKDHGAALNDMWRTAVATAYWARELARHRGANPELAHLCGLLHRIGRPVVLRCIALAPDGAYAQLSDKSCTALIDRYEVTAGAALSSLWNLPEPVSTAIQHWRDAAGHEPWMRPIRQLQLAELLAARTLGRRQDPLIVEQLQAAMSALQLSETECVQLKRREAVVMQAINALT